MKKHLALLLFVLILSLFMAVDKAAGGTLTGSVKAAGVKSPKDILIYVEKVEGREFAPPAKPVKMDQISLVFVPRLLPVIKGTTVEFHNSDDLKHNVFGVGDYDFDLGVWTKGGMETYTFDKLGEVAILCNVHPEMEAYIVVLQNPYFAVTNEEGKYQIKDVPAGKYKLKTWHDRLRAGAKDVEVPAEGELAIDFELKR